MGAKWKEAMQLFLCYADYLTFLKFWSSQQSCNFLNVKSQIKLNQIKTLVVIEKRQCTGN